MWKFCEKVKRLTEDIKPGVSSYENRNLITEKNFTSSTLLKSDGDFNFATWEKQNPNRIHIDGLEDPSSNNDEVGVAIQRLKSKTADGHDDVACWVI